MNALVRHLHARRILKTREQAAYWKATADTWRQLCSGNHLRSERSSLVEAVAKQKMYEARLESLLSNTAGE